MKWHAAVAALLALGVMGLLLFYNFGGAPVADETTRANYASSLQRDFAIRDVRDVTVSTAGAQKAFLRLKADWLDHASARVMIGEDIGPAARKYGFQKVIFENEG